LKTVYHISLKKASFPHVFLQEPSFLQKKKKKNDLYQKYLQISPCIFTENVYNSGSYYEKRRIFPWD